MELLCIEKKKRLGGKIREGDILYIMMSLFV